MKVLLGAHTNVLASADVKILLEGIVGALLWSPSTTAGASTRGPVLPPAAVKLLSVPACAGVCSFAMVCLVASDLAGATSRCFVAIVLSFGGCLAAVVVGRPLGRCFAAEGATANPPPLRMPCRWGRFSRQMLGHLWKLAL
jgi:hypothetical protein